jgi:hypothetical protein
VITVPAADAKAVERDLIKELDDMNKNIKYWPNFTPVK